MGPLWGIEATITVYTFIGRHCFIGTDEKYKGFTTDSICVDDL